jgi:hypothetical protein
MKRINQLVMVACLALGGQSVFANEGNATPENDSRDKAEMSVANVGASNEQSAMKEAKPAHARQNLLEELGIAGHGPLPSKGGPIDCE